MLLVVVKDLFGKICWPACPNMPEAIGAHCATVLLTSQLLRIGISALRDSRDTSGASTYTNSCYLSFFL